MSFILPGDVYIPKTTDIDTVRDLGAFSNKLSRVPINEIHQNPHLLVEQFEQKFRALDNLIRQKLAKEIAAAVIRSSEKHISHVALKTGLLRDQLREMFRNQYAKYDPFLGDQMLIQLDKSYPWSKYARYHIMEWDIRPSWSGGRYRHQQTLAHRPLPFNVRNVKKLMDARPIFIEEFLSEAGRELSSRMINYWAEIGLEVAFTF